MYYLTVWQVRNQSHWAKIQELAGLGSFLEAPGENTFPHLSQLLGATYTLGSSSLFPSSKPAMAFYITSL